MEGRRSARNVNVEYYMADSPGRADYWRMMAAPRVRIATFLDVIGEYSPRSVVDLGCGSGELVKELYRACPSLRLCGVDFSEVQIDKNRQGESKIRWIVSDLDCEQDFDADLNGRFDMAIASEIIEHMSDPAAFLKNARKLLCGDGILCLSTQSGRIWETERMVGHRRHFSADEIRGLLASSGWTAVRVWNEGYPFHDLSKFFANRNPQKTMEAYSRAAYGPRQRAVCRLLRLAYRFNSRRRGAQLFALARREG